MQKADRLLSIREASTVMNCCYSKTQKMAKSEVLPFRKLGGTWVIPRSALYRELGLEPPEKDKEAEIAR